MRHKNGTESFGRDIFTGSVPDIPSGKSFEVQKVNNPAACSGVFDL